MTLLLETNQRHSRLLFLSCLIIALMLSPVILCLVEHSVSGLTPAAAQSPADPNSSQWDMRSMWYRKVRPTICVRKVFRAYSATTGALLLRSRRNLAKNVFAVAMSLPICSRNSWAPLNFFSSRSRFQKRISIHLGEKFPE